jgi:hypothetical protein
MSENKRRWFQIHLSTAIVLMFAAGGFLFLNFSAVEGIWTDGSESSTVTPGYVAQLIWEGRNGIDWTEEGHFYRERHYGWPFIAFLDSDRVRFSSGHWEVSSHFRDLTWDDSLDEDARWNLALNVLCWCVLLASIVVLVPILERRRVRRGLRIHPSSLALLLIIISFLIWKNRPHGEIFKANYDNVWDRSRLSSLVTDLGANLDYPLVREEYAGWPFNAWVHHGLVRYSNGSLERVTIAGFSSTGWTRKGLGYSSSYDESYLPLSTYNVCVWLILIVTPCVLCEYLLELRRVAAR